MAVLPDDPIFDSQSEKPLPRRDRSLAEVQHHLSGLNLEADRHYDDTVPVKSYSGKAYRWSQENYSRQRRFIDIWSFVLKLMTAQWAYGKSWAYRGGKTEEKQAKRRRAQGA